MNTLYNSSGKPVAYLSEDNEHIYLYDGSAVGFVHEGYVYNYNGRYLGWILNGWYYDRAGCPAFFTENSSGGPAKPARQAKPARGAKHARPAKGAREARPAKPARSLTWSEFDDQNYFHQ